VTFVLHAPGPGVLHDAGDRDARLGIPAGWANTVGTIRSRSKQHVNVKRCWMLEDVGSRCYGNLWNVVGRCWEWMGMGDVRIRIWCHDMSWYVMICHDMSWYVMIDFGGFRWLLGYLPVAWWLGLVLKFLCPHGFIMLPRGLLSHLPEPLRTRLEPGL